MHHFDQKQQILCVGASECVPFVRHDLYKKE